MTENPVVSLMLALAIMITASRLGGGIARKLKQPRVLGELLVGVLLGPSLLNFLHWDVFHSEILEESIHELAELGVVVLMFLIGLEVNVQELGKVGKVGLIAGFLGAIVPIGLSYVLLSLFGYGWQVTLFAGVTLAATSVSISAQVLFELGFLQSKEGNALLATALIDDILAIILVSLVVALTGTNAAADSNSVFVILRMFAYLLLATALAWFFVPRLMNFLGTRASIAQSHGIPAIAFVLMLLFAWSAEVLGGVAMITGSFLAGLGLSRSRKHLSHTIEENISAIAYAFLVPIFFVEIGLKADLSHFPLDALPFALLLLVVAVISKIGGCGLGALWAGFSRSEALRLGVCMISRGEVGLIIASLGLALGVFEQGSILFSSLFLVILLTTLLTPIFVRWVFKDNSQAKAVD